MRWIVHPLQADLLCLSGTSVRVRSMAGTTDGWWIEQDGTASPRPMRGLLSDVLKQADRLAAIIELDRERTPSAREERRITRELDSICARFAK